jgi:hypothetical protein
MGKCPVFYGEKLSKNFNPRGTPFFISSVFDDVTLVLTLIKAGPFLFENNS